jgi:hypothetical protein
VAELIATTLAPTIRALEGSVTRPLRDALVDCAHNAPVNSGNVSAASSIRGTSPPATELQKSALFPKGGPLYFGIAFASDNRHTSALIEAMR